MSHAPHHPPLDPELEHQLREGRRREHFRLGGRQARVEALLLVVFAVACAVLAGAGSQGGAGLLGALALTAALALVQRVSFEFGAGWASPTTLVFVPLALLLEPWAVPLATAAAMLLDRLPELRAHRRHPSRAVLAINDGLFSVAPAAVLLAFAPGDPALRHWPVYLLALAAQLLADLGISALRAWSVRAPLGAHLGELGQVWTVDVLLAPVGLAAALAAADDPAAVLLVLPLALLLRRFSVERTERLDQALVLSETYRRVALVLGDVIGDDDAYTGEHTQSVVSLSLAVADQLGVGPRERQLVELGALLHDVGKIQVPGEIINKPGPLDDAEWAIMRRHTVMGQELLDRVGGTLHAAGIIVRASHERWDGGGYPDGLVGEAIPLAARIVTVADAYDAMTTDRTYRPARSTREALDELEACSGTHFDPVVVAATVRAVRRRELRRVA